MKLMGIAADRQPTIGVVKGERVVPLAPALDFYADLPRWLDAARQSADQGVPIASITEAPAVTPSARILCVGLNYRAHAAEGGFEPPAYPAIFGRWTQSLIVDEGTVPALDSRLDWECELAVIIGERMAGVDETTALRGVLGYAPFNDISARTYQRHTPQWTTGKNMDRSGAIGKIVTADEVGDPGAGLRIETRLNGQVMQSATTADMIFSVARIISYLSEIMTLEPGDVIASGTPEGVGHARTPPLFMKPGDMVEVEVEKVGLIRNHIVDASRRNG